MPPPRINRSVSTTTVSKSAICLSLVLQPEDVAHPGRCGLGEEHRRIEITLGRKAAVRDCFSFRCGADGEFEALHVAIAELDGPQDGIRGAHRRRGGSQRHEVSITAYFDGLRGADLDAVVAFPTHRQVAVVSLHLLLVQSHEIVGANMLACSLVQRLAPVAFLRIYITRHQSTFPSAGPSLGGSLRSCFL